LLSKAKRGICRINLRKRNKKKGRIDPEKLREKEKGNFNFFKNAPPRIFFPSNRHPKPTIIFLNYRQ
jgi:hypothetical protein